MTARVLADTRSFLWFITATSGGAPSRTGTTEVPMLASGGRVP